MRLSPSRLVVLGCALALATPATGTAVPPARVSASSNMKPVAHLQWRGGTDLELARIKGRRYVVAGAQNNYNPTTSPGLRVVDVTNPAKPKVTGFLPCNTSQNDIQVQGTRAFLAVDFNAKLDVDGRKDCWTQLGGIAPKTGVVVVELADPAHPRAVGFLPLATGAHNTTVHPTKPILYISESESLSPDAYTTLQPVYVVDVANPRKPRLLSTFTLGPGDSPHDITFNAKGTRAFVAAGFGGVTVILDTTKPTEPTILGRVADPAINFAHQADPTPDGKYLLVTDEFVGAEGNLSCPGGGIHVWDISNPAVPVKVGAYFIPEAFATTDPGPRPNVVGVGPTVYRCTAHVMRLAPDGKTLVMGWYSQGIQVLDISGLSGVSAGANGQAAGTGIKRLANWGVADSDTWSAKIDDRGYVYTGDTARGMDVVKYDRKARPKVSPGLWLTPQQALFRALRDRASQPKGRTYFCFERETRLGL
ncbi:MAG TPA: hypothetical protein VFQ85_15360 [Mycobacteriales bacterium]|jgi:hypothetical protein|nr:hypothetical protein [Mycobacteriales bacterium]